MAGGLFVPVTAASAPAPLTVTGSPALYPSFSPNVRTYVARCTPGERLQLTSDAPAGTKVEVDGKKARGGHFTRSIRIGSGQSVRVTQVTGGERGRYVGRCLPPGLPEGGAREARPPQAARERGPPGRPKETPRPVLRTNRAPGG